jgi:PIN domain nuclease of toxin-antitoxin system
VNVVIDTHALIWLLTDDKKISLKAKEYFRGAGIVFIPTIVILELMYMLKKSKEAHKFPNIMNDLKQEGRLFFVSLDVDIAENNLKYSEKLEMHDNIIVATAEYLKLPLITKDSQIQKVYKNTVW